MPIVRYTMKTSMESIYYIFDKGFLRHKKEYEADEEEYHYRPNKVIYLTFDNNSSDIKHYLYNKRHYRIYKQHVNGSYEQRFIEFDNRNRYYIYTMQEAINANRRLNLSVLVPIDWQEVDSHDSTYEWKSDGGEHVGHSVVYLMNDTGAVEQSNDGSYRHVR